MHGSLPIHTSQPPHFETISHDLDGDRVNPPFRFSLSVSEQQLHFRASAQETPMLMPNTALGEFVEGLWEFDVAEFFVKHRNRPDYLEVNLSPNGAWWVCFFDGYRNRNQEAMTLNDVKVHSEIDEQGWRVELTLPIANLQSRLNFGEGSPANVTAIIGGTSRHHMSWCKFGGDSPDFHRTQDYLPITYR